MDHWNVFMMKREENDLGEMGPSSLAEAGPNNLGGAGPSGIGGVEPTKKRKKGQFVSRDSKHKNKDDPFFFSRVSLLYS
jgi:hypothetical protein